MEKYQRLGGSNNRNALSQDSEGPSPGEPGLAPGKDPLPSLETATSSLPVHVAFPRRMHVEREKKRELSGACPHQDAGLTRTPLGFLDASVLLEDASSLAPRYLVGAPATTSLFKPCKIASETRSQHIHSMP